MPTEKLSALDASLQCRHAKTHATLNKGVQVDTSFFEPLRDWYAWQDGQNPELEDSENLFFDWYRFIPSREARESLIFEWESSLPLLMEASGDGYCFNVPSRNVFFNWDQCYDETARLFASFDSFIDFLIELADGSLPGSFEWMDRENKLLDKYTRYL